MGVLFASGTLSNQNISKNDTILTSISTTAVELPLESPIDDESKVQKKEIVSTEAKCSCSMFTDYEVHAQSWVNYCPKCHKYGTLVFEKTGDCPEGMVRCTDCDADYCAVHGKEHVDKGIAYLISA